MCVVQNFSQLEDAMRRKETRDVLVVGSLGNQLKRAITEQDGNEGKDALLQSFLKQIKSSYTVCLRSQSRCAPVVLLQNERILNAYGKGDDHGD